MNLSVSHLHATPDLKANQPINPTHQKKREVYEKDKRFNQSGCLQ